MKPIYWTAVLLVAAIAFFILTGGHPKVVTIPAREWHLEVRSAEDHLTLRSFEADAVRDVMIYLNTDPGDYSGFKYAVDRLEPANEKTLRLKEFTKENGERFNPENWAVKKIWLSGEGHNFVGFDFK